VLLDEADRRAALYEATLAGLRSTPKEIPFVWKYDERGSLIFEQITRLPEYYLTRAERGILALHAGEIASLTQAETLVELGSGTSEKTRLLLDALAAAGTLRCFMPLDVSEEVLVASARQVATEYPEIEVHAVVGDFQHHLPALPGDTRRLFAFLGSTFGNLSDEARRALLGGLAACMSPGDAFVLGLDLLKDPARIEAAYNDAAGLSEQFQRNALEHLDRELDSDFSVARFAYDAFWDAEREWIDLGFRSVEEQVVHVPGLGIDVELADRERLRTGVSTKFRRERVEAELEEAGLALERWWTDAAGDCAVVLAAPRS
jgi:L-histidine N-alpha-methyltransferase